MLSQRLLSRPLLCRRRGRFGGRGIVDFDEGRIRSVELLHSGWLGTVPDRLHGTLRARQGNFTGFVQWDCKECVGPDELDGHTAAGELSLRFDTIRSIARNSRDGALVTLLDGREIVLSDTREVGHDNRIESCRNLEISIRRRRAG